MADTVTPLHHLPKAPDIHTEMDRRPPPAYWANKDQEDGGMHSPPPQNWPGPIVCSCPRTDPGVSGSQEGPSHPLPLDGSHLAGVGPGPSQGTHSPGPLRPTASGGAQAAAQQGGLGLCQGSSLSKAAGAAVPVPGAAPGTRECVPRCAEVASDPCARGGPCTMGHEETASRGGG